MKFLVSPTATEDILDAIDWNIQHNRLTTARGLWKAWEQALQRIEEHPTRYPRLETNPTKMDVREFLIRRYRLRVFYEVRVKEVEVLAAISTWFDETTIATRLRSPNG